jgi:hypothetical protein
MHVRTAPFRVITQRVVVIIYGRFGTTYGSIFKVGTTFKFEGP